MRIGQLGLPNAQSDRFTKGASRLRHAANVITISRIILLPVLFFSRGNVPLFSLLYLTCGLTDVLDGYVARKAGSASELGAKLDSIADLLFFAAIAGSLVSRLGDAARDFLPAVLVIVAVRCVNVVLVAHKYCTFAILHTWGNKLTGGVLFATPLLVLHQQPAFLWSVCMVAVLSAVEETAIHITSPTLDLNRRSIFRK